MKLRPRRKTYCYAMGSAAHGGCILHSMFTKVKVVLYMNKRGWDILNMLHDGPYVSQRALAQTCGCSLGAANLAVRELTADGWIDGGRHITPKAERVFSERAPKNAVILAAGFGMRMIPINRETPKGLLEVAGEPLIERLIRQLREAGIADICVVVGFMKERYEYLIDDFGVELVISPDFAVKNNLHSLRRVADRLSNTYIVPCDIWCAENPFRRRELYSWYMVSERPDRASSVRVSRSMELVTVPESAQGSAMLGIAYLLEEQAALVRGRICRWADDPRYDGAFWETALYEKDRMIVQARVMPPAAAVEINTFEQLRELDGESRHLQSDAISVIADVFGVGQEEITGITYLKKGMTNRSFLFRCRGGRYIMRIPGEGTERLIDRAHEAAVYDAIRGHGLCDEILYIDPASGYKISRYMENVRPCDPESEEDLAACMKKLRAFHEMELAVGHDFDIFGQIEFYESLWEGESSVYRDHARVKRDVLSLRPYIEAHAAPRTLAHIDAVPDNFLFVPDGDGREELRLIDWEYAGMQDPHVDIAMFCIYALFDRARTERLIDLYFPEGCPRETRVKIYCYIAACGLLWSNWCEYKLRLGVDFGEYSLRQYRYAKEYFRIASEQIKSMEGERA